MAQKRCEHGKVICPACVELQDVEREFEEGVKRELFPRVEASATMLSLISDSTPDVKMCLEMGAALMFDKPLFGMKLSGAKPNENLERLAVEWFDFDKVQSDPEESARLGLATKHWAEKAPGDRFPKQVPWMKVASVIESQLIENADEPFPVSAEEMADEIVRMLAFQGYVVTNGGQRGDIIDETELRNG